MKRTITTILISLAIALGLLFLFIGISLSLSQITYGGAENLLVNAFFSILGILLLGFGLRWGVSREKRTVAVIFIVCSVLFLLFGINMFVKFIGSFPTPSDLWLQSMATSRAHILGEYPVIDDKLIIQGRIDTIGTSIVSIIFFACLVWPGRNWLKGKNNTAVGVKPA